MADEFTRIADSIVPAIFNPYVQNRTVELTALIQSGIMVVSSELSAKLAGGGLTFVAPAWRDLANEEENVGNDDPNDKAESKKRSTHSEIAVRCNRNQSWGAMMLTQVLAGSDPASGIGDLVAAYWARRMQVACIAVGNGIFSDNDAAPSQVNGAPSHTAGDMTIAPGLDGAGAARPFQAGVTNMTAEATIDALTTLGDQASMFTAIAVHSIVYSRMQKNNLIDFIPDARGEIMIPTFLGKRVIVDDGMPNPAGVGSARTTDGLFHSWLLTTGLFSYGSALPPMPTDTEWDPKAGNGQGMETLTSRVQYCIHPNGHAYVGPQADGGPTNAQFADAASWERRVPERKQVRMARLITREL